MKKILIVFAFVCMMIAVSACSKKEDISDKTLSDMENYLLDQDVLTGEKTETYASMIGAIEGFKYLDSNVEVYRYDTDSDMYKEIKKNKEVSGLIVNAINGPFILICDDEADTDNVVSVFEKFK